MCPPLSPLWGREEGIGTSWGPGVRWGEQGEWPPFRRGRGFCPDLDPLLVGGLRGPCLPGIKGIQGLGKGPTEYLGRYLIPSVLTAFVRLSLIPFTLRWPQFVPQPFSLRHHPLGLTPTPLSLRWGTEGDVGQGISSQTRGIRSHPGHLKQDHRSGLERIISSSSQSHLPTSLQS